jgi:hypothetical protein
MEVHHPDLREQKKKFKEYFFEFLMIFLAVTLGFFAETLRERISEKHREKDYIVGLINNIKSDTSVLVGLISRNDLEIKGTDSAIEIAKNNFINIAVQDSVFYYSFQYTSNLHLFEFNDLTLVQLRNAGGYSLIRTSNVADSIALYESRNNDIKIEEKFYLDYYAQAMTSFRQIFDCTAAKEFFATYNRTKNIPKDINVLTSNDKEKIHALLNNYWAFSSVINVYNNMLRQHLEYLKTLIIFLEKNFDIT